LVGINRYRDVDFSFWSHNQRLTVASIAVGIAFLLAGLLQACETWEEKIQRKIRAYEPLDIDAMRTLAVSVFHKDKLTREELRQWLDAELSAISDAALRGEAVMRDEERNNSLLRKMRMHIAEWEAVRPTPQGNKYIFFGLQPSSLYW
jgi:hypothetical protein